MFKKKALSFIVLSGLCLSFAWALATPVNAVGIIEKIRGNDAGTDGANMENVANTIYGGTTKAKINDIVPAVINAVLGLLGVIFLVLTLYAGFLWMTSQGNDESVKKAKGILTTAIIGLVIIVASYAISDFVLNALSSIG